MPEIAADEAGVWAAAHQPQHPYVITYISMPSAYRDGVTYDRISAPLERIGREVLGRLALTGGETVLDAGCGSGRVTGALMERLPRGHVIGIDGSPEMIDAARNRLGSTAELLVQDLTELDLDGRRVDAILSTATFHWLHDHARLFARLHAVLRPGGQLVAQCGGRGNTTELLAAIAAVAKLEPFAGHLTGWAGPWNFAGPDETAALLRAAGFTGIRTWLVDKPAPYDDLREWLRTNALTAHTSRLPEPLREPYIDAVFGQLGPDPSITYIRLNIDALASHPVGEILFGPDGRERSAEGRYAVPGGGPELMPGPGGVPGPAGGGAGGGGGPTATGAWRARKAETTNAIVSTTASQKPAPKRLK